MSTIPTKRVKRFIVTAPIVLIAITGVQATTDRSPLDVTVPYGTDDGDDGHAFRWIPASSNNSGGGH